MSHGRGLLAVMSVAFPGHGCPPSRKVSACGSPALFAGTRGVVMKIDPLLIGALVCGDSLVAVSVARSVHRRSDRGPYFARLVIRGRRSRLRAWVVDRASARRVEDRVLERPHLDL